MFKSEKINEFLNNNKHSFVEHVFKEFTMDQYQYIRDLLNVPKESDIQSLKHKIDAYERVLCYLKSENFDVSMKEYTNEELYPATMKILEEAEQFLIHHIDERIDRYTSIVKVSSALVKILEQKITEVEIEQLIDSYSLKSIDEIKDRDRKQNFYTIIFRTMLRVLRSEDKKVDVIKHILGEGVFYNKRVKVLFVKESKPMIVTDVPSFLKAIGTMDDLFYRGHSSANYRMVPSVYRDGLFFFEDRMIKEMMLELPEEFDSKSTHYDKMMKMQHYGIPTKLLDITSNPLVALFMACDGDETSDGEVLLIKQDSFDVCYPSSDRVKMLASVPFLSYGMKITLAYLISREEVTNQMFNQLAKALLHEIKHEMPAFEARIEKEDLEQHLFVLGPKRNKRIYAQSGHFIISPLTLKSFSSIPVKFEGSGHRTKILIPAASKEGILQELKKLNISRSTMYPEIEHVAREIKSTYL